MSAMNELIDGMVQGRSWSAMGDGDAVRTLLGRVYDERYHCAAYHKGRFQIRVNLQKDEDVASYAGWITSENPKSGPYEGTSFVWFPGEQGSVAVLVIGTNGFGADTALLGRPGHARRLRALSRLHRGKVWVKPDLLDVSTEVPNIITQQWPDIPAALKAYARVIYAAVPVRSRADGHAVEDLLDLFFHEHGTPMTGDLKKRWDRRLEEIAGAVFPAVPLEELLAILRERRFVVLEGPPGTGKTRLAYQIADRVGSATRVQFHAARTYEDFVVGLFPRPTGQGLAFDVRPGDLLVANAAARERKHVLVIDEINRADLARVLGEAIVLFEVGESTRRVRLPHAPAGHDPELMLSPNLLVLGTRNTADRTIARMDIAIRRRFAFVEIWPDLQAVEQGGVALATETFADTIHTFVEFADEDTLRLVPGHAYFLDPRPDLDPAGRADRVARRMRFELVPLLRHYLDEKLCGSASEAVAGLADRIESRLMER
ncbi:MAG TPA: AAA family ATPase [Myxococcota bacterium]|nr:AAA family ATPase [Myxococcota bacterium]HQK50757.1 AAA family ATPase [Myxococcota bacterium]